MTKIDKRDRAGLFRRRLAAAMATKGTTQAALARTIGVDRSTISQLLGAEESRLPNAQVVAECAAALGVTADWLLGLSDRPEQAADLLAASMTMTPAQRALVDEQIFEWHREADGYKIRHVPARLPDLLKTRDMLEWEYGPQLGQAADLAVAASHERLDWMRSSSSDYEIAIPLFEIDSLVLGTGYYEGLPDAIREGQIARFAALHDQLYPSLRVFLFDARRLHSAPLTIFGPLLAVIYVGQHYLAFRDTERVRALTLHFDRLVREARVPARSFPDHLSERLAAARGG
ncbi:MAG: helix-turn-helix transcriptional regulator [Rhodobacteraceae bacterium]|jgi:transcriptional regulator with XRE-family HTH domain|nr:helix-turn-helix transcriptional regulator [Paracoccaceae bacterium]